MAGGAGFWSDTKGAVAGWVELRRDGWTGAGLSGLGLGLGCGGLGEGHAQRQLRWRHHCRSPRSPRVRRSWGDEPGN